MNYIFAVLFSAVVLAIPIHYIMWQRRFSRRLNAGLTEGLSKGAMATLIEPPPMPASPTCELVKPDPKGDPFIEMMERVPDLSPDGPRPTIVPFSLYESVKQENTMLRSMLEEAEHSLKGVRTEQGLISMLLSDVLRPRRRLSLQVRRSLESAYAAANRIDLKSRAYFYTGYPGAKNKEPEQ